MELTQISYLDDGTVTEKKRIFFWENTSFTIPDETREWNGKWIWASEKQYPEFQECAYTTFANPKGNFGVFLFKKEWECMDSIDNAAMFLTSDASYKVYVNGKTIGYGSAQPGGDYANCNRVNYKFYEKYDITNLLKPGSNTVTVRVCLGAVVQSEISCGHGGLIADIVIDTKRGRQIISTDDTWRCTREKAFLKPDEWNGNFVCKEMERRYDDREWGRASFVEDQGQFPRLYATPIPNLRYVEKTPVNILNPFDFSIEKRISWDTEVSEIRIEKGAPISFWLDFGMLYAGIPHFEIEGNKNTKVVLHMQEFPGKTERKGTTETIYLGEGENKIESLRLHSIHYIQVVISNMSSSVIIKNPGIHVSIYPTGLPGDFTCSNPLYEEIYWLGCRTNQICRQTYHMDSPIHQEPTGCMGDYMIESLMNYYTFGDPYLTRFDILKIGAYLETHEYKMFHPSYCLLYIQMIYDYIMYTGDNTILNRTIKVIKGILKRFIGYLGENGLMEHAPNYMFMDWVEDGRFNRHHPPKCMGQGYLSALLAGTLSCACRIFEMEKGLDNDISQYQKYRKVIVDAINQKLWKPEKGLYVDGLYDPKASTDSRWMPADTREEFYSQHMNTLAVLYDVAPQEKQQELMVKVMENHDLSQAQPYFMHFIFNALTKTGLFEKYGLSQIGRWEQLLKENPSGLKEVWDGFDCDYSHAWGGTPTYQLPARILGVVPVSPGFREIYFAPCLPDELTFAKGTIPTPYGNIEVCLTRKGEAIEKQIQCPRGVIIRKSE